MVLRKVAANMGLPSSIVEKPKKAVQYATGINVALKKLAKKQKITVTEYVNKLFLNNANNRKITLRCFTEREVLQVNLFYSLQ